jgi:hypothetical protein
MVRGRCGVTHNPRQTRVFPLVSGVPWPGMQLAFECDRFKLVVLRGLRGFRGFISPWQKS